MKNDSVVVGMGIGQLYKSVLEELGQTVVTVDRDISKNADYPYLSPAIHTCVNFDTAHVCVPNNLHFILASSLAPCTKIVFIEKPGVKDSEEWQRLVKTYPKTRFIMVKNNQWRKDINELVEAYNQSDEVNLKWFNKNRIPSPGSWFTDKSLAFGGVSRDLLPHLLSFVTKFDTNYKNFKSTSHSSIQKHNLETIDSTDYGIINKSGVYNVDDYCCLSFLEKDKKITLEADWKNDQDDARYIEFKKNGNLIKLYEFGLCPEIAYKNMIQDCINNLNNDSWWQDQYQQDLWIHKQLEKF